MQEFFGLVPTQSEPSRQTRTCFAPSQREKESDKIAPLFGRQSMSAQFFRSVGILQKFIERGSAAIVQVRTALPQAAQRGRIPASIRTAIVLQFHVVGIGRSVLRRRVAAAASSRVGEQNLPSFFRC